MAVKYTLAGQLKMAKRALKLANGVMDYCGGDAWERECTAKDRERFNKIYMRLMNEEGRT